MRNSGIPQDFESVGSAKTAVVLLGNPEIFGYLIRCSPWRGGGGYFLE